MPYDTCARDAIPAYMTSPRHAESVKLGVGENSTQVLHNGVEHVQTNQTGCNTQAVCKGQ